MVKALSEKTTSDPFGKRHKQGHVAVFVRRCCRVVPGQRIVTHQSWINRSFLHQLLLPHPKWRRFTRTSPIILKMLKCNLNLFLITRSSHFYSILIYFEIVFSSVHFFLQNIADQICWQAKRRKLPLVISNFFIPLEFKLNTRRSWS